MGLFIAILLIIQPRIIWILDISVADLFGSPSNDVLSGKPISIQNHGHKNQNAHFLANWWISVYVFVSTSSGYSYCFNSSVKKKYSYQNYDYQIMLGRHYPEDCRLLDNEINENWRKLLFLKCKNTVCLLNFKMHGRKGMLRIVDYKWSTELRWLQNCGKPWSLATWTHTTLNVCTK